MFLNWPKCIQLLGKKHNRASNHLLFDFLPPMVFWIQTLNIQFDILVTPKYHCFVYRNWRFCSVSINLTIVSSLSESVFNKTACMSSSGHFSCHHLKAIYKSTVLPIYNLIQTHDYALYITAQWWIWDEGYFRLRVDDRWMKWWTTRKSVI